MTKRVHSRNSGYYWFVTILMAILPLVTYAPFLSPVNIPLSLFFIAICFTCYFKIARKPSLITFLLIFCVVYVGYALLSDKVPNARNSHFGMLNWMLKVQLAFIPAYYFASRGFLTLKRLQLTCIMLFVIFLFGYYLNEQAMQQRTELEDVTNNSGYLFVSFIPLMFLNFKKNGWLIILSLIMVVLSFKRGAIVCGLVIVFFSLYYIKREYRVSKAKLFILATFVLSAVFAALSYFLTVNEYAAYRFAQTEEGNYSGRENYFFDLLNAISDFDAINLFFGKGINYSFRILNNFAHNDWLELMTSMGFLGVTLYLFTFWGIWQYSKMLDKNTRIVLYMMMTILFVKSNVSMSFFSQSTIPLYYVMGLLMFKPNEKNSRLYRHI